MLTLRALILASGHKSQELKSHGSFFGWQCSCVIACAFYEYSSLRSQSQDGVHSLAIRLSLKKFTNHPVGVIRATSAARKSLQAATQKMRGASSTRVQKESGESETERERESESK